MVNRIDEIKILNEEEKRELQTLSRELEQTILVKRRAEQLTDLIKRTSLEKMRAVKKMERENHFNQHLGRDIERSEMDVLKILIKAIWRLVEHAQTEEQWEKLKKQLKPAFRQVLDDLEAEKAELRRVA